MSGPRALLDEADLAMVLDFNPFSGDRGPQPRRLRNEIVTASKAHACSGFGCDSGISEGERHRQLVEVVDGDLFDHRWCQVCLREHGRELLGIS